MASAPARPQRAPVISRRSPAAACETAALCYLAVQMPTGILLTLALGTAIGVHLKTRNAVVSVLGATVLNVALSTLWQT